MNIQNFDISYQINLNEYWMDCNPYVSCMMPKMKCFLDTFKALLFRQIDNVIGCSLGHFCNFWLYLATVSQLRILIHPCLQYAMIWIVLIMKEVKIMILFVIVLDIQNYVVILSDWWKAK